MDIIRLLPDAVANQIAAGEVVQRPASVVKELIENAVDSGATEIQLIVKDAGRTLIQVIDNGKGMSFNDARLCFERHATSKLRSADDLFRLTTKGFRGEALASIAAIAHVELKTKPAADATGTLVLIEGAEIKAHEVIATTNGSSVAVKNLFFNVPARRNFLKSDNIEMTHIEEEFYRVALIHHELAFTLYHNGKLLLKLENSNFRQRIVNIFGNHFKDKLFPVEQVTDFMKITGFIAKPENAKKKKSEQYMFINHRYVRHNLLNYAVETAYSELIPQGYRPAYFIEIEIDPSSIDINVSPTKVEVKLQDEKLMFGFLNSAVKKSLGTMSLTPQIDFDVDMSAVAPERPANHEIVLPSTGVNRNYNPFDTVPAHTNSGSHFSSFSSNSFKERTSPSGWEDFLKGIQTEKVSAPESTQLEADLCTQAPDNSLSPENISENIPYFIIDNRYIFCKLEEQAMLVDIVHARERIMYDRFMNALQNTPVRVQQNLFPSTITLTPAQADLAESLQQDFLKLGYELEKIDNTHFAVNGTPNDNPDEGDIQAVIEKTLDDFKTNQFLYRADNQRNMAICMARQQRSRFKPLTSAEEVRDLLQQLFACDCPSTAPSDKKIIHWMGSDVLKRYFE